VGTDEPVIREMYIAASPEEVFPYLTEGDKYVLWMGLAAEISARPGGVFRIDPNTRDIIAGEFVEIIAPRRVVFTWGFAAAGHPMPAGSTRVEIDLEPHEGGTLLRLTHRGLPADMKQRHESGWDHYWNRLQMVMAGQDPGPDPYAAPEFRHS